MYHSYSDDYFTPSATPLIKPSMATQRFESQQLVKGTLACLQNEALNCHPQMHSFTATATAVVCFC